MRERERERREIEREGGGNKKINELTRQKQRERLKLVPMSTSLVVLISLQESQHGSIWRIAPSSIII